MHRLALPEIDRDNGLLINYVATVAANPGAKDIMTGVSQVDYPAYQAASTHAPNWDWYKAAVDTRDGNYQQYGERTPSAKLAILLGNTAIALTLKGQAEIAGIQIRAAKLATWDENLSTYYFVNKLLPTIIRKDMPALLAELARSGHDKDQLNSYRQRVSLVLSNEEQLRVLHAAAYTDHLGNFADANRLPEVLRRPIQRRLLAKGVVWWWKNSAQGSEFVAKPYPLPARLR